MSRTLPVYAILLAGGSGTRLWPLSRKDLPKQLLSLDEGETLLQQTARRLLPQVAPDKILTVTHESYQEEVRKQLGAVHPELTRRVLAEQEARNTLPAIAWAVEEITKESPDALIGVFPADHLIRSTDEFQNTLTAALRLAEGNYLVTLGIPPSSPETGYGYIEAGDPLSQGACRVRSFTEKPSREIASRFLQKGNYYWNSGMFVFRATTFQEALRRFVPEMQPISIDYGIMEKADNVAIIPASFSWNDLGSWEVLYREEPKDEAENVTQGDVMALDTRSSLLLSRKGLLTTIGIENMVVVQTEDAVLVSRRDRTQDVKKIVAALEKKKSPLVTRAFAAPQSPVELSVVVPIFEEESTIPIFLKRMLPLLERITAHFEIVFCMDPGGDRTEEVLRRYIERDKRIRLIIFSRRFGQPAATIAGIKCCLGNACIVIDVDLQDPPELIPELVKQWRGGYDVVYAQRRTRKGETLIKRLVAYAGYKLINYIAEVPIPPNTGDFRLMSRRVIESLRGLKETHGFLRGLVAFTGYRQTAVLYDRDPRQAGRSKYNRFTGSIKIGMNGVIAFSTKPLALASFLGFAGAAFSILLGSLYILEKLFLSTSITPGIPTTVVVVSFFASVQLITLGIMGEYIGRIYDEVRYRPQYMIAEKINFPES